MDTKIAEKVNKLAKSLKDNHLAANMEEAFEKAKQILCTEKKAPASHAKAAANPPISELKTVKELFIEEEKSGELAEKALGTAEEIEKELKAFEKSENDEEAEIKKMEKEISDAEEELEEMREEE